MLTIKNQVRDRALSGLIFLIISALLAGCGSGGPRSFNKGMEAFERGDYPKALEHFRVAASELSTNAVAWHYLGLAAQNSGQPHEAERAYARALTLDRDLIEATYNLGCLLLDQNRAKEAKAHFTTYHLRRPNDLDGCLKLGSSQLRSQEALSAEKSFGEALRLSPNNPDGLNGLGLARLQRSRPQEAVQFFAAAVRHSPGHAPALLNLAIVRDQHLGDKQGALQAYRDYLNLKPAPANAAAVSAEVVHLETQLAAARRRATNPVPSVASSPPKQIAQSAESAPPVVQNRVSGAAPLTPPPADETVAQLRRPAAATSATSNTAKLTPPPVVEPAKTAAKPMASAPRPETTVTSTPAVKPPETVNLLPEPKLKPAQDVVEKSRTQTVASAEKTIVRSPPPQTAGAPRKKGFFQSMNPMNLFQGGDRPQPGTTVVTGDAAVRPGVSAAAAGQGTGTGKVWPRYQYQRPVLGQTRDRAAAESAFARGVQVQKANRLQEAVQVYRQATFLDPRYYEAHYNLGLALATLGNTGAALAAYEDALAANPGSLDVRYNFALTLSQANFIPDAMAEFKALLQRYPNEARAHLALGNIYSQQLGQPAQARPHYVKVLELEPRHPQGNAIRYWLAANPA